MPLGRPPNERDAVMYGRAGIGGLSVGGGLAATGAPIMMALIVATVAVVSGLLLLRWSTVRRHD